MSQRAALADRTSAGFGSVRQFVYLNGEGKTRECPNGDVVDSR